MRTINLNTEGGEFYLKGTTTEYVGFYNVDGGRVLSGRSPSEDSVELEPVPEIVKSYLKASKNELPESLAVFVPSPSDADYKRGWFMRYFARQFNVPTAPYYEIDQSEYDKIVGGQKTFYVALQIRWKITGPEYDNVDQLTLRIIEPGVRDTNNRSIKLLEPKFWGLSFRLQNLIEFWNGQRNAYFAPQLTKKGGKLEYDAKSSDK